MIKTYEALLATALLIGTLAMLSSPYFIPEEKYSDMREVGEDAFLSFAEEENFRNLAVGVEDAASLQTLKDYIDVQFDYPYTLRVCRESDDGGWGSVPTSKNFALISYMLDGLSGYPPGILDWVRVHFEDSLTSIRKKNPLFQHARFACFKDFFYMAFLAYGGAVVEYLIAGSSNE